MIPLNYDLQIVEITPYDDETTVTKKYFKEPIAGEKVYKAAIQIEAQVRFKDLEGQIESVLGDSIETYGTLIIDYDELEDNDLLTLKNGDLITKIDDTECTYRIIEVLKQRRFVKAIFIEGKLKIGGVR